MLLLTTELAVDAAVYTHRDSRGVHHFSNKPLPGWAPFDVGATRERRESSEYDPIIRECGERYEVEPALVKAVIRAESGFDPQAVSPRGARGLMQLMPHTARSHGVARPEDPRENIQGGVRHLRSLLDRFDRNPKLAIAAYNAGARSVARYRGLPPYRETRAYVAKVLRFRREYLRQERVLVARSG